MASISYKIKSVLKSHLLHMRDDSTFDTELNMTWSPSLRHSQSVEGCPCLAFRVFQILAQFTFLSLLLSQMSLHTLYSLWPQALDTCCPFYLEYSSLPHLVWFISAFPLVVSSSIFSLGNSSLFSLTRTSCCDYIHFISPSKHLSQTCFCACLYDYLIKICLPR